jgi:hypothetical protein
MEPRGALLAGAWELAFESCLEHTGGVEQPGDPGEAWMLPPRTVPLQKPPTL